MSDDVSQKIKQIIAEKLKLDANSIKDEAGFIEDLGADSLDVVEMVMKMEDEFGIQIPDDELEGIKTVSDAIAYVKKKLGK